MVIYPVYNAIQRLNNRSQKYFWNAIVLQEKSQSGIKKTELPAMSL